MKTRILLAGLVVAGFTSTAMADEYYVMSSPDHHCTITTTKPADKEVVTQIGPLAFKSREEAQTRITKTKDCGGTVGAGSSSTTIIKEK
jgi:hypothetical protein